MNRFDHTQVRDRLRALDLADSFQAQVLLNDDAFAIEGVHSVSGDHVKVLDD
jgi:DNA-dependent RNA polymerase auxiliary subunit epsilon